jgi:hypothetical protein
MRREIELKRPTRRKKEALIAGGVDAPAGLVAVCLVACTKEKRPGTHPAARLYVSEWFRKASAFAARSASRWFVLSAKYGLLAPDRRVACYDQVLTRMTAAERREWAGRVLERLIPQVRAGDRVLVLAGLAYREHLLERLRRHACTVEVPMEGLGIGRQLQWLKRKEAGRGQDR